MTVTGRDFVIPTNFVLHVDAAFDVPDRRVVKVDRRSESHSLGIEITAIQ
jgi:hypothetical protein